ncbi:DUF3810 domain-containing protein [Brotaphodocola sp.]|uniref:DUF3810 domain-containing protein n=1 Tax=Brotaphodocola sp. TaxID=3073577 RepID=UPI003D7D83F7
MREKTKIYMELAAAFLILALAFQVAARKIPGFADWYAHHVYPMIVGSVGRAFGCFPFSVSEFGIYLLIGGLFGWLVWQIRVRKKWLVRLFGRVVTLVAVLFFLYTMNCGINYHARAFSEYAGIETGKYTTGELAELCGFLTEKVNENAPVSEEDRERYFSYKNRKWEWQRAGVLAMQAVGEKYPVLAGFYPKAKQVTVSDILSVQQLSGIYSPFTVEANYNGAMTDYNIPHTICHELSHLKGFMREDEANFIACLACSLSGDRAFRYSGYLLGWIHAANALADADLEAYRECAAKLGTEVRKDLARNNEFWDRYDTKTAKVANQINDTYLKANLQEDGVKSYGRVVDLMLAYRKMERKEN